MTTINVPGGTERLLKYEGGFLFQYLNGWEQIPSVPITVNRTGSGVAKILFTNDMIFFSTNMHFIAGTPDIQFGSESLNPDGSIPTMTVTASNYPGLIQNGTSGSDGNSNVYVYNLYVNFQGNGSLAEDGGWIAQTYFGKNAVNNYIVGCVSDGPNTNNNCGGIVGSYAGYSPGSTLFINGCSSFGDIGFGGGGIVGGSPAVDGSVSIVGCYSFGQILGDYAGGIAGVNPGANQNASITITNCFTIGSIIGTGAGGIVGSYANKTLVDSCFNSGTISGTDSGGIFGSGATSNTIANNCYTSETISGTNAGGIFGNGSSGTTNHCYIAAGSWNSVTARSSLQNVDSVWLEYSIGYNFLLNDIQSSLYTLNNIVNNQLVHTVSQTIPAGGSSTAAAFTWYTSNIINVNGVSNPNFTIDEPTGIVTVAPKTPAGSYLVRILSFTMGPYRTSTLNIMVTASSSTPSVSPRGKGYDTQTYIEQRQGDVLVRERLQNTNLRFKSFEDYMKYKKARASLQ